MASEELPSTSPGLPRQMSLDDDEHPSEVSWEAIWQEISALLWQWVESGLEAPGASKRKSREDVGMEAKSYSAIYDAVQRALGQKNKKRPGQMYRALEAFIKEYLDKYTVPVFHETQGIESDAERDAKLKQIIPERWNRVRSLATWLSRCFLVLEHHPQRDVASPGVEQLCYTVFQQLVVHRFEPMIAPFIAPDGVFKRIGVEIEQGASGVAMERKHSTESVASVDEPAAERLSALKRRADEAERLSAELTQHLVAIEKRLGISYAAPKPKGKIVLGYWKIRGLAQPIRYLMSYIGLPFEDKLYEQGDDLNREEWNREKPHLALDFPNLPYLIDGDLRLTQSCAITHYIVSKYCPRLGGSGPEHEAKVQMVLNELIDFRSEIVRLSYHPDFEKLVISFEQKSLPNALNGFSRYLAQKSWLTGEEITVPDFVLYELLDQCRLMLPSSLNGHLNLLAFLRRFEALPAIRSFQSSPGFIHRPINNKSARFR